jgi:hypothetical protein
MSETQNLASVSGKRGTMSNLLTIVVDTSTPSSADRESEDREEMTNGEEELYNERRKMLVDQYPVQRLPKSRHPAKSAR